MHTGSAALVSSPGEGRAGFQELKEIKTRGSVPGLGPFRWDVELVLGGSVFRRDLGCYLGPASLNSLPEPEHSSWGPTCHPSQGCVHCPELLVSSLDRLPSCLALVGS